MLSRQHVNLMLLLMTLPGCSAIQSRPVTEIIAPVCDPVEPVTAKYPSQAWLNQVGVNIVKQRECIKQWEAAAKAHNKK